MGKAGNPGAGRAVESERPAMPGMLSKRSLSRRRSPAENERDDEKNDKDEEEYLCDRSRRPCHSSEAEDGGNNCDDQECDCVT